MKRMGPKVQGFFDAAATLIFVGILSGLVVQCLAACKATCAAIDLAAQTCPLVVQYADEFGHPQTAVVTHTEFREFAKAAREALALDAGVEAGK